MEDRLATCLRNSERPNLLATVHNYHLLVMKERKRGIVRRLFYYLLVKNGSIYINFDLLLCYLLLLHLCSFYKHNKS